MSQKIKTTRQDLVNLVEGLRRCSGLQGKEFALISIKNNKTIQAELDKIRDKVSPSDKMKEYFQEREALLNSGTENMDAELKALEEKYAEEIAANKEKQALQEKMLKEEVEIKLIKVPEQIVPGNITTEQLAGIELLLDI